MRARWTKAQGLYIVNTSYGERTIYNEQYDAELNRAKYDTAFQPDGEWGFYEFQH